MNGRERALDELKRRIREQKARVNPKLLKLAENAALSGRSPAKTADIPYDRVTAAKAVELFLEMHRDRSGFERRLAEFIVRNRH